MQTFVEGVQTCLIANPALIKNVKTQWMTTVKALCYYKVGTHLHAQNTVLNDVHDEYIKALQEYTEVLN